MRASSDGELLVPTVADLVLGLAPVLLLLAIAVIVAVIARRAVRAHRDGELVHGRPGAPTRTKRSRLDELDELRRSGRISDEELADARSRILAE